MTRRFAQFCALALLGLPAAAPQASADAVEDFYRGRDLTILVEAVGGGYGTNCRIMIEFMGRYIPGRPKLLMVAKPGAGGRTLMNYLYNVAPRDGTMLGFLHKDIGAFSLLLPKGVKYETRRFQWIGSIAPMNTVFYVTAGAPAKTLADAKKTEVIVAANGTGHPTYLVPTLLNNLLQTRFKIVTGYRGGRQLMMALEQGEAFGTTNTWENIERGFPNWRAEKKFYPLVHLSLEKDSHLPEVPLLRELVANGQDREVVDFLASGSQVGRAFAAPPGVPADRIAALRQAFDATMKDAGYLAAAKKAKLNVEPKPGAEIQKLADTAAVASPALVGRAKALIGLK